MKTNKIVFVAVLIIATAFAAYAIRSKRKPVITPAGNGFVLIELFTSEGCSSCPPADELVARVQKEDKDKPVYILAYHVDYWNNLGWKDQFSNAAYSQRQRQYAAWLQLSEGVYTPQIVVNGKKEFVGSDEKALLSAIQSGLQKASPATLTLSDINIHQLQATVHYQADGIGNNTALLLALVEKSAQSHVKAGENNGRTLSHVQIVSRLQSVALKSKSGTENITIPGTAVLKNTELIGFLQNTTTGEIIAATKIEMPGVVTITKDISSK